MSVSSGQTSETAQDLGEVAARLQQDPRFLSALKLVISTTNLRVPGDDVLEQLRSDYLKAQSTEEDSEIELVRDTIATAMIVHGAVPAQQLAEHVFAQLIHEA